MENRRVITFDESKIIQLDILKNFHDYCEQNKLKYYLAGGTLIGAVRHKGFIPWDDDIDVFMPRRDYELFITEYNYKRSNDNYYVISINNTPNFYLAEGKLIDLRTELKEEINSNCVIGVAIDIIPLDNMSDNRKKGLQLFHRILRLRYLLDLKLMKNKINRRLSKTLILSLSRLVLWPIPQRILVKHIDQLARRYEGDKYTRYVAAATMAIYGDNEVMPSEIFKDRVMLEFEHNMFYAPAGYDEFLKNLYGNYMELPPVEKQVTHHSNEAYWRKK